MRKIFGVCTLAITVFAVSAAALPRAEAMTFGSLAGLRAASHEANLVQSVDYYGNYSHMGITSHMHITRGMDITGLFVVPGGRGAGWSLVTTRMSGRADIITTDRTPMATGD